ncbi:MAG: autotransporter domain-containing protein [Rhabdochlamydiaceae bacterium]|nr:autotransporter domain-containing protein [Rhabdochlamydiaceae bacterium]
MKRLFMLCGCMSLYSLSAHATTTYTWSGSAGSSMTNASNWTGAVAPVDSQSTVIVFPGSSSNYTPTNDLGSNFQFDTITFGSPGSAYTLTGDSFLISGAFGGVINFDLTGSAIESTINIASSSSALNVYSTGINTIGDTNGGGLSGSGVLNVMTGQLNIGGTSTFNGSINITSGSAANTILQATAENSLGSTAWVPLLVTLTQPAGNTYTAELNLNGYNQTLGGISGTTGTTLALGTANLTLSTNGSYATPFYGDVTGSGNLLMVNNATLALLGDLTGFTGNVSLDSGASLFTNSVGGIGSFTIEGGGGTLQFQLPNPTTLTQDITMTGTTTIATNGSNITCTGSLSGAGTLIKLGRGSLILNGTNTGTTGPVLLEGGTLQASSTTLPSGPISFQGYSGTLQAASDLTMEQAVSINIGGTIDTNSYNVTINGQVSGGAPFTKAGAGILMLTNNGNNFTGRTTILEGTLNGTSLSFPVVGGPVGQLVFQGPQVGRFQAGSNFSTFPSIVLTGNGVIDTNSYDVTLSGVVAGSHTLVKEGAGTLTLTNTSNNFTGNVQINNGTLNATPSTITANGAGMQQLIFAETGNGIFQLGATFPAFKADILLQNNGTIDTTANGYDITIDGNVIGEPTYTLHTTGTGQVNFNGQFFFSGLLNLREGTTTYMNGISACDINVTSGSILRGTTIATGNLTILSGGAYHPGNSIGHPTLGSLNLNSGATTILDMDATDASSITVTGSASIDGTLTILPEVDAYAHQGRYLLVSANSLNGTFASVTSSPGFTFNVNYLGNEIYLDYTLAIPTSGLSGNALKTANYLNAYAPPSDGFTQLAMLTGDALPEGLNSVSPARNGYGTYITAQTAFSLSNALSIHLDNSRFMEKASLQDGYTAMLTADSSDSITQNNQAPENTFSGWVTGFGQYAHQKAAEQNPSFNFNSEAALAGFDYHLGNKDLVGASLGYANTYYRENQHAGHGDINYYFASLYGNAFMGDFYLSPAVWGMFNQTQNTRKISFSGFEQKAKADIYAWQLIPHLEAGYNIEFSWGKMIPFSEADWAISWQRGYQEHGASAFNVKQKAKNSSMVRSETGLKFSEQWAYTWGSFFLKEKASYVFEKTFGTGDVNASFVGAPSSFTVTSVNKNLNLGAVGLDFVFAVGKQKPVKIELGLDGEFGANYWATDVALTINKDF